MWHDLSPAQIGFFGGYLFIALFYVVSEYLKRRSAGHEALEDEDVAVDTTVTEMREDPSGSPQIKEDENEAAAPSTDDIEARESVVPVAKSVFFTVDNPVCQVVTFNESALIKYNAVLRMMAEFGLHMAYYFLCDRTDLFPEPGERFYSRDMFFFLYLLLVLFSFYTSLEKVKGEGFASREQTAEWKGWMQVLFVMYHYFAAREQYNSIRVYIAGYVWMTGYGNYSFYCGKRDYSFSRFCWMMWRLNFLVFWVCVVLGNDYMLYYICPMHTLWTVAVYLSLLLFESHNTRHWVIYLKCAGCLFLCSLLWVDSIFFTIWKPFTFLVGFTDPNHPEHDPLHEWFFRSGLDRYVWVFGMVCANLHPKIDAGLKWLDESGVFMKNGVRVAIGVGLLSMGAVWVWQILLIDGHWEYNKVHPYTSFLPIGIYLILRNLTPTLRRYHLAVFAWLGKVTLETYIGQFHIWLHTGGPNYSPKSLLTYLEGYHVWKNRIFFFELQFIVFLYLFISLSTSTSC